MWWLWVLLRIVCCLEALAKPFDTLRVNGDNSLFYLEFPFVVSLSNHKGVFFASALSG
jgi:hypothetical protein